MTMRIAKFLSDNGVASRRVAEKLIANGVVAINGNVIDSPVNFVGPNDVVTVNGKQIDTQKNTELYAFYKPINTMTTAYDPHARKTIYDVLPEKYKNLRYVGRLDYKTTGLLLLTNDGELARRLTLPSSKIPRVYIATVSGNTKKLDLARRGITVDGIRYAPMKITETEPNILRIEITEGKKNEIRIVMRACGCPVVKLHRIKYGKIELGNLTPGQIKKISQKTIDEMIKTL
ncbi:MAG: rRNA pseudouridine synthase [Alphaproteobacteria bacterium]|nr:rRNA pseudouridine synthase [Alphaproteobacteria bacterium]